MHGVAKGSWRAVLMISVAVAGSGYKSQLATGLTEEPAASKRAATQANIGNVASEVATGVGEVRKIASEGTGGPLFVFEEFHTSRVGQLQIAVMLLRLHDRHGLRIIGLEGHLQSVKPLDVNWFHTAGGSAASQVREDVALRLLAEGEISSAEFMAMAFADLDLHGLERGKEYAYTLDVEGSPATAYLLHIAEKKLSQSDIQKINDLIERKKEGEAVEYIMNADPWVRRQYEALKDPAVSVEALANQLREIRDKARDLRVEVDPKVKEELDNSLRFMDLASQRSATMTEHMLGLREWTPKSPTAMVIGAGHTDRVIRLLGERNVPFAIMTPKALNPEYANLSMDEFVRKNDREWSRTSLGTVGSLLNAQRKPPPFIGTVTAKSGASAYLAAKLIADAARGGKRVPADIRAQITGLPEFRLDWDSFRVDGHDVIYRGYMKQTSGVETEAWFRVGSADGGETSMTLEEKLLQRIVELGGDGNLPPRNPPLNSQATADKEGPGDGKRTVIIDGEPKVVVISRVGWRGLMVVAESQSTVNKIGRLSG